MNVSGGLGQDFRQAWGKLRALIVSPDGMMAHWHSQHRRFVDAIANRDPASAEEHARFHVEDVFRKMREGVDNTPEQLLDLGPRPGTHGLK